MVERKTLKNKFIGAMRHKEESEREKERLLDVWKKLFDPKIKRKTTKNV